MPEEMVEVVTELRHAIRRTRALAAVAVAVAAVSVAWQVRGRSSQTTTTIVVRSDGSQERAELSADGLRLFAADGREVTMVRGGAAGSVEVRDPKGDGTTTLSHQGVRILGRISSASMTAFGDVGELSVHAGGQVAAVHVYGNGPGEADKGFTTSMMGSAATSLVSVQTGQGAASLGLQTSSGDAGAPRGSIALTAGDRESTVSISDARGFHLLSPPP